jgi:Ribose/xylose/arabinose/galactoside ABC-type transport systems, permease components
MQSQDKMQTGQNADGQTKAASRPDAISSRAESTSRAETLARNTETYRELGLAIFIVILSVIFQIRNPKFLSLSNIKDMLANTAILSILTVGMMMVIITRGIDLSIGSTMALAGMITSLTVSANPSISPFLSLAQGMAVGLAAGLTIGVLVAYFNILPIIATLGLMNILRGMTYLISKGKWVSAYQMSAGFKNLSTGTTFGINNLIIFCDSYLHHLCIFHQPDKNWAVHLCRRFEPGYRGAYRHQAKADNPARICAHGAAGRARRRSVGKQIRLCTRRYCSWL